MPSIVQNRREAVDEIEELLTAQNVLIFTNVRRSVMNLNEIIRILQVEKERVEDSIAALEALDLTKASRRPAVGRRGRKYMGAEERKQVSERMKRYWEGRRQTRFGLPVASSN